MKAVLVAAFALAAPAAAPPDGAAGPAPAMAETVRPLSRDRLPGGQDLVAVEVDFPPGAAAHPHRHPAFVYAYVVSGRIVSAVDGETPRTYRAGESWHEAPGAFHRITRNASRTKPARLLAIFVAEPGETRLVQPATGGR